MLAGPNNMSTTVSFFFEARRRLRENRQRKINWPLSKRERAWEWVLNFIEWKRIVYTAWKSISKVITWPTLTLFSWIGASWNKSLKIEKISLTLYGLEGHTFRNRELCMAFFEDFNVKCMSTGEFSTKHVQTCWNYLFWDTLSYENRFSQYLVQCLDFPKLL